MNVGAIAAIVVLLAMVACAFSWDRDWKSIGEDEDKDLK